MKTEKKYGPHCSQYIDILSAHNLTASAATEWGVFLFVPCDACSKETT